jgi:hypothetical protein
MHNFTYWQENLMQQIMLGYENAIGIFVWPLLFMAVIGYVYLKQQSFVAAAIATLIIISAFGNYLVGMELWVNIMYILVSLSFTGLFLIFLSKRRN